MTHPTIEVNFDQLSDIVRRFEERAGASRQMHQRLQGGVTGLQNGGWAGVAAEAFYGEMDAEIFPALARLEAALEQAVAVTRQISDVMQQAEEEASAPFRGAAEGVAPGGGPGGDGASAGGGAGPSTIPPPRIYIVNGINSAGNVPGARDLNGNIINGDDQSVALEELLEKYGYDPDQVTSTSPVFPASKGTHLTGTAYTGTDYGGWLSPVDWLTGQTSAAVNTVTNAGAEVINQATGVLATVASPVVGTTEVLDEYLAGEHGKYTEQVYNDITRDLNNNPLAPGQKILLMGHSGGGAIVANLAGKIEENSDYDVSGIVTMGSPVSNYDEAGHYAEVIADVRHVNDRIAAPLGTPMIRSEESRLGIPAALTAGIAGAPLVPATISAVAVESAGRISGATPNVQPVTLDRPAGGIIESHGSYMHDDKKKPNQPNVSVDMLKKLSRLYPNLNLQLPAYSL